MTWVVFLIWYTKAQQRREWLSTIINGIPCFCKNNKTWSLFCDRSRKSPLLQNQSILMDKQDHPWQWAKTVKQTKKKTQRKSRLFSHALSNSAGLGIKPKLSHVLGKHTVPLRHAHTPRRETYWMVSYSPNPRDLIWLIFHLHKRHQYLPPFLKLQTVSITICLLQGMVSLIGQLLESEEGTTDRTS